MCRDNARSCREPHHIVRKGKEEGESGDMTSRVPPYSGRRDWCNSALRAVVRRPGPGRGHGSATGGRTDERTNCEGQSGRRKNYRTGRGVDGQKVACQTKSEGPPTGSGEGRSPGRGKHGTDVRMDGASDGQKVACRTEGHQQAVVREGTPGGENMEVPTAPLHRPFQCTLPDPDCRCTPGTKPPEN